MRVHGLHEGQRREQEALRRPRVPGRDAVHVPAHAALRLLPAAQVRQHAVHGAAVARQDQDGRLEPIRGPGRR